jgi:hypothetical protein
MKNTLAENLLRFGVKNLSESSKQKLTEADASDFVTFEGEPSPLQNVLAGGNNARVPLMVLQSKTGAVEPLIDKINYIPANPAKNTPEAVSVMIADRNQTVNWSVVVTKDKISPSRVNKVSNTLTGYKIGDTFTAFRPGIDPTSSVSSQLLMRAANYDQLPSDHALMKIKSLLQ